MKKRHFYHSRIRTLSIVFCLLIASFIGIGVANAQGTVKEKITIAAKTAGVSLMFAPLLFVTKLKEKGVYDKLDEETKTFVDQLETSLNETFKSALEGKLSKKEIEDLIAVNGVGLSKEQKQAFIDQMATVKTLSEWYEKNKDGGINKDGISGIRKGLDEFKIKDDGILKNTGRKGFIKFEFEEKAGGADQAATDIQTHTIGLRVPGIGQIPTRKPFMADLFSTIPTSLEYIKYMDQETVVRDAKNVLSAASSTHTSKITWKERQIQIVNIRDLVDVPIDMLQDYDFVEGELRRLLNVNVALKKDDGLLNGTGVAPELHSVAEAASEFDATNTLGGTISAFAGTIQTPNIFDLVIAMSAQIVAVGKDGAFMPDVVLFNTIDRYKSLLIKDKNDNYLMPPFVVRLGNKEYSVDGMRVRSNPNVPANSCWVFDSSKGTIYQRKRAVAEMSFENATNFETEVVTMKVYERLNLLIRNVDKNAFMKCTDVATALAALQAP